MYNKLLRIYFFLFLLLHGSSMLADDSPRITESFNEGWYFKKGAFSDDHVLFINSFENRWQETTIPHTWNAIDMQNDKNNYYAGEAYYRKLYNPDIALENKRVFLRFEGVASVAEVYVNKAYAGNHKGGYSAFVIEITKLLKYGENNEILVKVDNTPRKDVIPINNTLFGVYGGIYRPVELIVTDKVNIAVNDYASPGIFIRQKNISSKSADVNIKVKIDSKQDRNENIQLVTTIYETDGRVKARQQTPVLVPPQGRQIIEQCFNIKNPHLWQGLEDPYLYKVVTQLMKANDILDEVVQPLGIRHFELRNNDGMYLNGKKVPMYGVCRHQDWWGLGSALSNEHHDKDLEIIKEIGATTIRFAHYQQAEYIYAKCDSIGFIVWAEIPFVNRVSTKEGDNAKQQLTELIRQNYNHPSIYVWGLHNEVYTPYDYAVALTTELNDLAKTEDPDRYTVSVSGYSKVDQASNLNADIQGINHYFGWYNGRIGDVEKWASLIEKEFPDHKVIFSEYGAEANIFHQQEEVTDVGDCCGFDKNYNETFATRFHEVHWGTISRHPYLLASYIWNTFDFATPASSQGGVEARNMKGLVTFDRKIKKDPFYWYKANWSKEPVLYITQRRVVERSNEHTPVVIYSNVEVPRLLVNGVEYVDYSLGNTSVHYIFDNIKLSEGRNIIKVIASNNGQQLQDEVVWYYSSDNEKLNDDAKPELRTKEHIGL